MRTFPSQNKYRNRRVIVDGITFDSKREATRYQELKLLERAGQIENLQLQVVFPLVMSGVIVTRYRADFTFVEHGELKVCDAKGFATDVYKLKRKMIKAQYGIDIIEL